MNAETSQSIRGNNHLHAQSSEARKGKLQPQSQPPPQPSSSDSSSPAHEFSFTISLHQSTAVATPLPSASPCLVDLSPADDIFFHGHLLPLHLLSHPPSSASPRSSTNSLESFTLPIRELLEDPQNNTTVSTETISEETPKSKYSFSLLKWRKDNKEETKDSHKQRSQKKKRKLRFDVSHVLKRYIRMVRPIFISLRKRRSDNGLRGGQSYSFSGSLTPKGRGSGGSGGGRRGLFSAPASMRTSPTNSGPLVAMGQAGGATSTSDSTMEELQAAIQAAIAHCKKSIAMDDGAHNNKVLKC